MMTQTKSQWQKGNRKIPEGYNLNNTLLNNPRGQEQVSKEIFESQKPILFVSLQK